MMCWRDRPRSLGPSPIALASFVARIHLSRSAAIARPVFRRVPTDELDDAVVALVRGWVDGREEGESFRTWCDRTTDHELAELVSGELAPVALTLDQLGGPDHGSATKTTTWRVQMSGPSKKGRLSAPRALVGEAET